jgi:hypothetical protein
MGALIHDLLLSLDFGINSNVVSRFEVIPVEFLQLCILVPFIQLVLEHFVLFVQSILKDSHRILKYSSALNRSVRGCTRALWLHSRARRRKGRSIVLGAQGTEPVLLE